MSSVRTNRSPQSEHGAPRAAGDERVNEQGAEEGAIVASNLIGRSLVFQESMRMIRRVSRTDATVLIRGETGTGKELAARAIHYMGARSGGPFIAVNCGALPDTLVENELFGHQRGAFTGAVGEYPGLLRLSHTGTLFLDEVDSLPLKAQVSLLRFLQDRRFRPLGGHREEEANVRILAASNRDLEALIQRGDFRADLYYRLKLISISLPPLRTRDEDIELLAEHFLHTCALRYNTAQKHLHTSTRAWLRQYDWPGNIRELENIIHSGVLMADGMEVCIDPPATLSKQQPLRQTAEWTDGAVLPAYAQAKARALAEFDRQYLTQLLAQTDGNVTRAAKLAGKERRALGKLIKRYKIGGQAESRDCPKQ